MILQTQQLEGGYGASQVLFGVDVGIKAGQVVTVLGRNGMGKSTLLKTILGLLPIKGGSVEFDGQKINGWSADKIARAGIAIVPEGRHCFPNLTVKEHLTAFAANRNPSSSVMWTPEMVFDYFPRLRERQHNMGNQLSGGEQQMLAIGRALVTNPKLLILDEASEGLAPKIREEIWQCLDVLRAQGQTILIIDKYVIRLMKLADHHIILEKGVVVWQGDSEALGADRSLWERYLGV